jgi:hypothetical protein
MGIPSVITSVFFCIFKQPAVDKTFVAAPDAYPAGTTETPCMVYTSDSSDIMVVLFTTRPGLAVLAVEPVHSWKFSSTSSCSVCADDDMAKKKAIKKEKLSDCKDFMASKFNYNAKLK